MPEGIMIKTKNQPDVYQRESITSRFHGKATKHFYITFKDKARKIWEKVGWISEGYLTQLSANIRAERMRFHPSWRRIAEEEAGDHFRSDLGTL
jgi:hypothetical protein